MEALRGAKSQGTDEVIASLSPLAAETKESMRSFATTSGAFAGGALVLLNTNIPVYQPLIIIGMMAAITNTALLYVYVFHEHTGDRDNLRYAMRNYFVPIGKLLEKYDAMSDKEARDDDLDREASNLIREMGKRFNADDAKIHYRQKPHYLELFSLGLFLFSVAMLGLGLIMPHVCWGILGACQIHS
jgi:hypothetical protein